MLRKRKHADHADDDSNRATTLLRRLRQRCAEQTSNNERLEQRCRLLESQYKRLQTSHQHCLARVQRLHELLQRYEPSVTVSSSSSSIADDRTLTNLLSDTERERIVREHHQGASYRQLAARYQIARSTVHRYVQKAAQDAPAAAATASKTRSHQGRRSCYTAEAIERFRSRAMEETASSGRPMTSSRGRTLFQQCLEEEGIVASVSQVSAYQMMRRLEVPMSLRPKRRPRAEEMVPPPDRQEEVHVDFALPSDAEEEDMTTLIDEERVLQVLDATETIVAVDFGDSHSP